jgi:tetratricopeptide (TPR) repeat protein
VQAFIAALACAWVSFGVAAAATLPLYQPPAAWVKPIAIPTAAKSDNDGAAQILLQNVQTRFSAGETDFYSEDAVKILSARGMSQWGNIIISWRPDVETLVIHRLNILRGDQVIDLLKGGEKVAILRRETNLEMAMLDGTLTATVQPEGMQVGDILDLAYTKEERDPVLKGHSEDWTALSRPGVVDHAYIRATWPKADEIRWRATEGFGKGILKDTGDGHELIFDMNQVEAPLPPSGAPLRFGYLAQIQMTDFANWAEVSTLSNPLYLKASTLSADSPLRVEIARIKAASPDPKVRAMQALKLVEDKVRYLYLGLNNGGYIPADADVTWSRRFGDCKAKTALLLALLRELGIDAQPALVNTAQGDGLDERLPTMDAFDHVAVRARIAGKSYWLDGTRIGDVDLDGLPTPNFHWMLPVQAAGGVLERLQPAAYAEPHIESHMQLDATAGLDAPAQAHVVYIFRGDEGLAIQQSLESVSKSDLDRNLRQFWRNAMRWIEPKDVTFSHDDSHNVTITMDGAATMNWSKSGEDRDFFVEDSNIGSEINIQREPGPNHNAPFATAYPLYVKHTTTVLLPNKGAGFQLANNAPVNQVVAGTEYRRTATLQDGKAQIETSVRALAPEFPASEAQSAAATLRQWSLYAVAIRSSAALGRFGADWDICHKADPAAAVAACTRVLKLDARPGTQSSILFARGRAYFLEQEPDQAMADYRRAVEIKDDQSEVHNGIGAVLYLRNDFRGAIQEYDVAIKMDANAPSYWTNRGLAYARLGDMDHAIENYSHVLAVKPTPELFRDRGRSYTFKKDWDRAIQDFTSSIALKADSADAFLDRGNAYLDAGKADLAVQDFNEALRLRPADPALLRQRGHAYSNSKNWDRAIQDFDLAIKARPDVALYFVDRGYARQMSKNLDEAILDYGEAIALNPKYSLAYRNRGLAYYAKHDLDLAIQDYNRDIELAPQDAVAYRDRALAYDAQKQWDKAIADYDQAIRLKADYADAFNGRGFAYQSKGNRDQALLDYSEALKIKPDYRQALVNRGLVRAAKGDNAQAIADYDSAIQLDPKEPLAIRDRGLAYFALKNWDRAIQDYDLALQLKPDFADALNSRGFAYQTKSQPDRAIQDYTAAIGFAPMFFQAYLNRGLAYGSKGSLDLAAADFDRAIELQPQNIFGYRDRGRIRMAKGDRAGALLDFTKVVALAPMDPISFLDRAKLYGVLGDFKAALNDAGEAVRLKPDLLTAISVRGQLKIAAGQLADGLQDLNDYVRLSANAPDSLNVRCWERAKLGQGLDLALADCDGAVGQRPGVAAYLDSRGFVRFRRGDYESAIADLDRALELNPKLAASLYIRGLAKQRLNRPAEAEADIAAAKAIAPGIAETYAKMGVSPQGAALASANR